MTAPESRRPGAAPEPWADPAAAPYVRLRGVTKRFGDFVAVDNVSLDIYEGELFCLLGASGCGKSTLLRLLAGFETPTFGEISLDGADVAAVPAYERPVNMMFQSYALFPHMTVEGNVAFGLKQDGLPRSEIAGRVAAMLDLVKLRPYARRRPHQLSGGQRQRVALARALVKRPKLLLLDEPLGALDRKLREETQFELLNIQEETGITFVIVTHDQEEAMTLATRIGVMEAGRIVQIGTPSDVYEQPGTRFVADFVGSVNLFEGRVVESAGGAVRVESAQAGAELRVEHAAALPAGTRVWVALRPEKIALGRDRPERADNALAGIVDEIAYTGNLTIYLVELASGTRVRVTVPNLARGTADRLTWDERVWLAWPAASAVALTA